MLPSFIIFLVKNIRGNCSFLITIYGLFQSPFYFNSYAFSAMITDILNSIPMLIINPSIILILSVNIL